MPKTVPPQWPERVPTRIAFITDAPGETDIDKGLPLMGSTGKVFDSLLRTANLQRSDYFVGTVFNERIPTGDLVKSGWLAPTKEARDAGYDDFPMFGKAGYLRPAHRHHFDRLANELADAQPTVIVPLGAVALWALTGDAGISANRGSVQPARYLLPGKKVIGTFNPEFVVKQWKFYTVVVGDFIKAFKQSSFPEIREPKMELLIEPTFEELDSYLPRILGGDPLSVDIETGWGQITNIGFAPDAGFAVNVPLVDLRKPNRSYFQSAADELRAWKWIKRVLESDTPKLGQNFGSYDAFWLLDRMGIAPRRYCHDTRLLHHAIYPELPKDLEFMGASYTDIGAWKSWGRKSADDKRDH